MQYVKVRTLISGEIDCADLKASLLHHKDRPAIINLNIGTTMTGVVDDIDLVIKTLEKSGFSRDRFYIHCPNLEGDIMAIEDIDDDASDPEDRWYKDMEKEESMIEKPFDPCPTIPVS
ncbi:hypothetical protein AHAS_Ahas09G0283800 [Arachis hypogaea]